MRHKLVLAGTVVALALVFGHWQSSEVSAKDKQKVSAGVDKILKDAGKLTLGERVYVSERLAADNRVELLSPDRDWMGKHPSYTGEKGKGLCRILNRGEVGDHVLGMRGGGAYWSFSSKKNDYHEGVDIGLEGWAFHSGFANAGVGIFAVVEKKSDKHGVEDMKVSDIPEVLTKTKTYSYSEHSTELKELAKSAGTPAAEVGKVYVMRSIIWGQKDNIIAFEVLEIGKYGLTLAYRRMKENQIPSLK